VNDINETAGLRVDAMIDYVAGSRVSTSAPDGHAQEAELVAQLASLSQVEWPADEVGDRITRTVAAALAPNRMPRRSRLIAVAAVAAAAALVAGAVQLSLGSHGRVTSTGRAGAVARRPTPSSPASTAPARSPDSLTAMMIVSRPGALRSVGVIGSNNDWLTCVTRTVCYIQGYSRHFKNRPIFARTENGGMTWTAGAPLPVLPPGNDEWNADLSCPTALTCFSGYGSGLIETSDGFAHYTFVPVTSPGNWVNLVSCTTTSDCAAMVSTSSGAQMFLYTRDGGGSWNTASSPTLPGTVGQVMQLRCDGNGACIALVLGGNEENGKAGALASTDGGQTWTPLSKFFSEGTEQVARFSCGNGRNCLIGGNNRMLAWIHVSPAGHISIRGDSFPHSWRGVGEDISCVAGRDCFVETTEVIGGQDYTDNVIEMTRDGGLTWEPIMNPLGSTFLSCPVRAGCIAVAPKNDTTLVVLSNLRRG
jgi:hypothetical protein